MADPDFKNIKFAYVRVVNGYPSIDGSMTDRIFYSTNPDGYYRCFLFPKSYFSGVDHEDLRNLISIEKSSVWSETLRSTLLGYNAVSNEFILNLNAYYGLKVDGLKTDGNLKYSGQASWQVMKLTTTQESDSIVTLKQTNGTNIYLSIKPIEIDTVNIGKIYPPLSVELEKKSIQNAPLLIKNDMLWAKSPQDGTPIMVNNCIKPVITKEGNLIAPLDDNKKYGFVRSSGGTTKEYYVKSMRFGKELVYFKSTATTEIASLLSFQKSIKVANKTGVSSVEYTDTSLLSDILASGQSLTFQLTPKDKYVWGYQTKSSFNEDYPNAIIYNQNPNISSSEVVTGGGNIELTEFVDKNIVGYEYSLMSCDTQKPFLFNSQDRVYGLTFRGVYIDATKVFENLPDGYIALAICTLRSKHPNKSIVRWKKGENIKSKDLVITTSIPNFISVNGTTQFGNTIYGATEQKTQLNAETVQLNDIVNATGFTDVTSNDKLMNSDYFSLITIVRL